MKVTEHDVNCEMVKRGWARWHNDVSGGSLEMSIRPPRMAEGMTWGDQAALATRYELRRLEVRAELQNRARGAADPNVSVAAEYALHLRGLDPSLSLRQAAKQAADFIHDNKGVSVSEHAVRSRIAKK